MPGTGLTLGAALGIIGGSSLLNGGLGFLQGSLNQSSAERMLERQIAANKELFDYQFEKANSPKAMVRNLTAAGLNPAAAFGNTSPVQIGGSLSSASPANYNLGVGTQSVSDLANLLVGAAQAKKAGIESDSILQDVKAKELQNEILSKFGLKRASVELALAVENVSLAKQSGDLNKLDMAIKDWTKAKEKALSEVSAHQRDILKKQLDNEDLRLDIQNRLGEAQVKTEATKQTANLASAESSRASAEQSRAAAYDLRQSAVGKELANNIAKATNLYDIENALFSADVLSLLYQSEHKEEIWQELQRQVKLSSVYKNSDKAKEIDASLFKLARMLGLSTSVSFSSSK